MIRLIPLLLSLALGACFPLPQQCPGEDLRAWRVEHNRAASPVSYDSCGSSAVIDTSGPDDSAYLYTDRTFPPGTDVRLSASFTPGCDGALAAVGLLDLGALDADRYLVSKVLAAGAAQRLEVSRAAPAAGLRLVLLAQAPGSCRTMVSGVEVDP